MDIELARTFLSIVRCGSFIASVEQLCITQTTVTARIKSLEAQLNCALFVRNRAGARLTVHGEYFVHYFVSSMTRFCQSMRTVFCVAI